MNVERPTRQFDPAGMLQELFKSGVANSEHPLDLFTKGVADIVPLAGGSMNRVFRADSATGRSVVFKWHESPPSGFFAAEHSGLKRLAAAQALTTPEVYAVAPNGIVMEWLGPNQGKGTGNPMDREKLGIALGTGLAKQHRTTDRMYGLNEDNFIGLLPQVNRQQEQWIPFLRECRLQPQFELAESRGRMTPKRWRWAERLLARLPEWIDEGEVVPSLLHGDLWAGNWLETSSGPAVIDPAVYYGDREMDIAMAKLFGGFPRSFFDSYDATYPLVPGHGDRRPLYQLYYLLIHLNIFGESYGRQVDRLLQKYGA